MGELATNYFSLREADAELRLLAVTLEGYQRSLEIARNRYDAGIAAQTDVLQAQTLYVNTQAERVALKRTRDTLEHAIAVLVGAAPAEFSLPAADWKPTVPGIPAGVPSTLLQRRPDIAASERAVAAANAQIGIARSAYFPSFSLSGALSSSASRVGDLFNASNTLWSLGLSVAQTVFDAGAIGARVDAAKAAHEAAVARYRQTVLTAFQDVEDQLTAGASLAQQEGLRREASAAADLQRAAVPQPLPAGAGELHRRGDGAGVGAECAAHAAAVAGEPAERGGGVDPGLGWGVAGGVDGRPRRRAPAPDFVARPPPVSGPTSVIFE